MSRKTVSGYENTFLERNPDGTWKDYKRATIEDVPYIGRTNLLRILVIALQTPYYSKPSSYMSDEKRLAARRELCLRDASLIAIASLTGGRIREVLMLHADNFDLDPQDYVQEMDIMDGEADAPNERIRVTDMPLLKRYTTTIVTEKETEEFPDIEDITRKNISEEQVRDGYYIDYKLDKKDQVFRVQLKRKVSELRVRKPFGIPTWERPLIDLLLWRIKWAEEERDALFNPPENETTRQRKRRERMIMQRGEYAWLFPTTRLTKRLRGPPGVRRWIKGVSESEARAREKKGVVDQSRGFGLEVRPWLSLSRVYRMCRTVGENAGVERLEGVDHLWDHFWRSQWASHLGSAYGFSDPMLSQWFSWEEGGRKNAMAKKYSNVREWVLWKGMKDRKERAVRYINNALKEVQWNKRMYMADVPECWKVGST